MLRGSRKKNLQTNQIHLVAASDVVFFPPLKKTTNNPNFTSHPKL